MKPTQNNAFWRNTMTRLFAASAALALTAGAASAASVTTIYLDDFSGGSGDLNGTTPDVGANNWVAAPMFNADGTVTGGAGSATVAFTPVDGLIYTLDASFTGITGDANWLAMGFAEGQSAATTNNNRFLNEVAGDDWTVGKAWMLVRGDNSTFANVAQLGNADGGGSQGNRDGADFSTPFAGGGDIDLRILLDTTDANWTATWFAKRPTDGTYTQVRAEATLLDETINSVGLASSSGAITGNVTSFQLTSVPSPSSLAMGALGTAFCVLRRRRK